MGGSDLRDGCWDRVPRLFSRSCLPNVASCLTADLSNAQTNQVHFLATLEMGYHWVACVTVSTVSVFTTSLKHFVVSETRMHGSDRDAVASLADR